MSIWIETEDNSAILYKEEHSPSLESILEFIKLFFTSLLKISNSTTGYNEDLIGAEQLIHITGNYGIIKSSTISNYNGIDIISQR